MVDTKQLMLRRVLTTTMLLIVVPSTVFALPLKGFHEGPYIRIIGGVETISFDDNFRTGEKIGGDYEPAFGFHFGWNLWDTTAPELEVRYTTKKHNDNREHVVNVNLNVKYSFVTNSLTEIGGLQILPFVQGGPAVLIAAVPGDVQSTDRTMLVWGLGFGGGAGIDFLFYKYVYLGLLVQCDIHHIHPVYQTVGSVSQRIVAGGWEPQLGIMGAAGVHF